MLTIRSFAAVQLVHHFRARSLSLHISHMNNHAKVSAKLFAGGAVGRDQVAGGGAAQGFG
jgi:hypothetical protein